MATKRVQYWFFRLSLFGGFLGVICIMVVVFGKEREGGLLIAGLLFVIASLFGLFLFESSERTESRTIDKK